MTDRLKQIWSGFEKVTTRHLTGSGVDHVLVPRRTDYQATDENFLPKDYEAPSEAAFVSLRTQLAAAEQKARARKTLLGKREEAQFDAQAARDFEAGPLAADQMMRGLKATDDRVKRRNVSYVQMMADDAKTALHGGKKRKKFLGIF